MTPGLTFDAGGLIALDRRDRRVLVLVDTAGKAATPVTIPASALAQAVRDPARQARLSRLLRQPSCRLVPLDGADAIVIGRLLAATGTSDVVDAHVVVCARRTGQAVVTSDREDLNHLDPSLRLVVV